MMEVNLFLAEFVKTVEAAIGSGDVYHQIGDKEMPFIGAETDGETLELSWREYDEGDGVVHTISLIVKGTRTDDNG